jgi:putative heme-binding domain-containing protein
LVPQREAIDRWMNYLREIAPDAIPTPSGDWEAVRDLVSAAESLEGDPKRGQRLFEAKSCGRCHDGGAVGPDLAGITGRFSYEDLFRAIADPDHDVSERYRGTLIQTKQGTIATGLVVYESVDGVTLKDGQATHRIESKDIEFRKPLETSLMPRGLLKDATVQDIADVAAYLKTVGR